MNYGKINNEAALLKSENFTTHLQRIRAMGDFSFNKIAN